MRTPLLLLLAALFGLVALGPRAVSAACVNATDCPSCAAAAGTDCAWCVLGEQPSFCSSNQSCAALGGLNALSTCSSATPQLVVASFASTHANCSAETACAGCVNIAGCQWCAASANETATCMSNTTSCPAGQTSQTTAGQCALDDLEDAAKISSAVVVPVVVVTCVALIVVCRRRRRLLLAALAAPRRTRTDVEMQQPMLSSSPPPQPQQPPPPQAMNAAAPPAYYDTIKPAGPVEPGNGSAGSSSQPAHPVMYDTIKPAGDPPSSEQGHPAVYDTIKPVTVPSVHAGASDSQLLLPSSYDTIKPAVDPSDQHHHHPVDYDTIKPVGTEPAVTIISSDNNYSGDADEKEKGP